MEKLGLQPSPSCLPRPRGEQPRNVKGALGYSNERRSCDAFPSPQNKSTDPSPKGIILRLRVPAGKEDWLLTAELNTCSTVAGHRLTRVHTG